ncbi:hypothetical protein CDD83_1954 [Cordyceps sp. RAO-2017]|nr:hypothetical protein CDD83_1954 [Cordyceps sp. RAO-2017]
MRGRFLLYAREQDKRDFPCPAEAPTRRDARPRCPKRARRPASTDDKQQRGNAQQSERPGTARPTRAEVEGPVRPPPSRQQPAHQADAPPHRQISRLSTHDVRRRVRQAGYADERGSRGGRRGEHENARVDDNEDNTSERR